MNAPPPIRAKLIAAASALVFIFAISIFHGVAARSSGEIAFRFVTVVFAAILSFLGVFGSAQLQMFWGWGLAVAAPVFLALCLFAFRGSDLIGGLLATLASALGGYLLLADAGVRVYRESIRKKLIG